MKKPLILLMVLLCCAPLACAYEYTYTAPSEKAVTAFSFDCAVGTHGSFILYFKDGNTMTGSFYNEPDTVLWAVSASKGYVEIDGESDTRTNVPADNLKVNVIANPRYLNTTQKLTITGGQIDNAPSIQKSVDGFNSPMMSYSIVTDVPIEAPQTDMASLAEVTQNLEANDELNVGGVNDLIGLLTAYTSTVVTIFLSLIYWLKFLFVDHLIITVVLYLTGTMAVAANTSRDIFKFFKTWFKQQVALFNFISNAFATTFQIVTQVAAVVGNAMGNLASLIGSLILKRI